MNSLPNGIYKNRSIFTLISLFLITVFAHCSSVNDSVISDQCMDANDEAFFKPRLYDWSTIGVSAILCKKIFEFLHVFEWFGSFILLLKVFAAPRIFVKWSNAISLNAIQLRQRTMNDFVLLRSSSCGHTGGVVRTLQIIITRASQIWNSCTSIHLHCSSQPANRK